LLVLFLSIQKNKLKYCPGKLFRASLIFMGDVLPSSRSALQQNAKKNKDSSLFQWRWKKGFESLTAGQAFFLYYVSAWVHVQKLWEHFQFITCCWIWQATSVTSVQTTQAWKKHFCQCAKCPKCLFRACLIWTEVTEVACHTHQQVVNWKCSHNFWTCTQAET
jgi:hypothetical protein